MGQSALGFTFSKFQTADVLQTGFILPHLLVDDQLHTPRKASVRNTREYEQTKGLNCIFKSYNVSECVFRQIKLYFFSINYLYAAASMLNANYFQVNFIVSKQENMTL